MCLGALDDRASDDTFRAVVLHVFGHLLGLVHEHPRPEPTFPWDRAAVYAELMAPPYALDRATIDANVFDPATRGETNGPPPRAASIMRCPVPLRWTGGTREVHAEDDLSEVDIEHVRALYT